MRGFGNALHLVCGLLRLQPYGAPRNDKRGGERQIEPSRGSIRVLEAQ